jgi:hopanoid biosynthesis associated protein HpnK
VKRLIVTGDDFGLAEPVNEAIEEAHLNGILTTASLMVGAPASRDAVARAKRFPSLRVGLHLVLVEGKPVLPPDSVPGLVERNGEFSARPAQAGIRFFFLPGVRGQLEAEIRAQFQAFRTTGLALDHVNGHNHMHLHPTVLSLVLKVGREFGLAAVRVPYEPPLRSWRMSERSLGSRLAAGLSLMPWTGLLRTRLRRQKLRYNDFVFGMFDTGAMTTEQTLRILGRLPDGITEIYFHPATHRCPEIDRTMPEYRHEQELAALTSPLVKEAVKAANIERISFSDL